MSHLNHSLDSFLLKCYELGVRLSVEQNDQLTIDAPDGVLTEELIAEFRRHKVEILAQWKLLEGDENELESGDSNAAEEIAIDSIDPADLVPCKKCGSLELWETALGAWRCMRCDYPKSAFRAIATCERIKKRRN